MKYSNDCQNHLSYLLVIIRLQLQVAENVQNFMFPKHIDKKGRGHW